MLIALLAKPKAYFKLVKC